MALQQKICLYYFLFLKSKSYQVRNRLKLIQPVLCSVFDLSCFIATYQHIPASSTSQRSECSEVFRLAQITAVQVIRHLTERRQDAFLRVTFACKPKTSTSLQKTSTRTRLHNRGPWTVPGHNWMPFSWPQRQARPVPPPGILLHCKCHTGTHASHP